MEAEYKPSYLTLYESGELEERVEALEKLLFSCTVCPHDWGNNRMENELARFYSGRLPIVSSYTQHFGEEPVLVGRVSGGPLHTSLFVALHAHLPQGRAHGTHSAIQRRERELSGRDKAALDT